MAVKIIGYDQLQARFAAISGPVMTTQLMKQLGTAANREQALLEAPHRKTGITGASIRLGAITPTTVVTQVGGAGAFLEFGTRPHEISPRTKKALAFASQGITTERFGVGAILNFTLSGRLSAKSMKKYGNAAYVVVKSVHHPGTKPDPFMVPGAQAAIQKSGANLIGAEIVNRWDGAA